MKKSFYLWFVLALIGSISLAQPAFAAPPQCEIHQVPMKKVRVPIAYGLIKFAPGYFDARKTEFPNSHPFSRGGCFPGWRKYRHLRVCPKCREAEEAWHIANPRSAQTRPIKATPPNPKPGL